MPETFKPRDFVAKLKAGIFDHRLREKVQELDDRQLEQVGRILTENLSGTPDMVAAKPEDLSGEVIYEEGAEELLTSPNMRPYVQLLISGLVDDYDIGPRLREIAALPLEKRYVWRVASALKWGFADFSSVNVDVDRETMPPEDRARVTDLVRRRPAQLCMFLKALVGEQNMEMMMHEAIAAAKEDV
jgi:hypothetical protein